MRSPLEPRSHPLVDCEDEIIDAVLDGRVAPLSLRSNKELIKLHEENAVLILDGRYPYGEDRHRV